MKKINAFITLIFLKAHGVSTFSPSSSLNSSTRFNTIGFTASSQRANNIHVPTSTNSKSALNAARRPLLSEDDLAAPPSEKVIEAVNRLGGNDVLASDVAAEAGLPLSLTKQSLSSIASLTRGDISVTESGDLLYSFPGSIQGALASNSLRYRVTNTWSKDVWPKLFWGIRVGFGVFLFISIALIFSTLFFAQTSSSSDDRDDRRGGGMGFPRYGIGNFLFDLAYYNSSPYYGYYGRVDVYDPEQVRQAEMEEEERSGIFEGIFSYIFGDGDPNGANLEAARLRECSRVIRANGGAVTAEQLAPFCDLEDPDEGSYQEGFVLPIVSQLGGEAEVTEDGDIIYIFPDLQVSARDDDYELQTSGGEMEYLEEKTIEFSRNPTWGNFAAGGLGVVNLGGALYLGQFLAQPALSGVTLSGVFGLVQAGYPFLLAYAILFNAIPAARYFSTEKKNAEIKKRNTARRKWLNYLQLGNNSVTRKLQAAKKLRQNMRRLGSEDRVYDTTSSVDSLKAEREQDAMKRFDEMLDSDTSSKWE